MVMEGMLEGNANNSYRWCDIHQQLSMSKAPSISFSPSRCAELYNQLCCIEFGSLRSFLAPFIIHKAFDLSDDPIRHPNNPETPITDYLADGIIAFLEAIDTWRIWDAPERMPFLPFAHPPTIDTLCAFSENGFEDRYPYAVLLYGDAGSSTVGRPIFLYGHQILHAG